MTDKKVLDATNKCFQAFRNQFENLNLDSDAEVVVQRLVIARIIEDADMGAGELEIEAPKLHTLVVKQTVRLMSKAIML